MLNNNKGANNSNLAEDKSNTEQINGKSSKWSALNDNFLMNNNLALKDWDKELSEDEGDDEFSAVVNMNGGKRNGKDTLADNGSTTGKKQKR